MGLFASQIANFLTVEDSLWLATGNLQMKKAA